MPYYISYALRDEKNIEDSSYERYPVLHCQPGEQEDPFDIFVAEFVDEDDAKEYVELRNDLAAALHKDGFEDPMEEAGEFGDQPAGEDYEIDDNEDAEVTIKGFHSKR